VSALPPFPGAIGMSHLRVYASVGPDGLAGGTPHVHTTCTEAYAVVAGEGVVQTLSGDGYGETPLLPGTLAWFTPGTIHRLINVSGDLEIVVLMANAGLPEAGDMVIAFPPEVLDDADAYAAAATLEGDEATTEGSGTAAQARRDLGVTGFLALRDAEQVGNREPLARFWAQAATLVRPRLDVWRQRFDEGPVAEVERTRHHLDALAAGDASHLHASAIHRLDPPGPVRRMGCCGTLGTYVVG
jgi:mannose-6-phosphate isomerase-like protein (cupin superfamily)